MRSHTGGVLMLGKGATYATSTRQKLVTKSSTEAELVGVSDALPQVIWTRYFLEEQGYGVKDVVIYQDNKSAILLEQNDRASSGRRTRHINIWYFFINDRINNKEVRVEYCPTGEMISDFFTKPLQGSTFRKFRDLILNVDPTLTRAINIPDDPSDNITGPPSANEAHDHRSLLGPKDKSTSTASSKQREIGKSVKWADQNSVSKATQQPVKSVAEKIHNNSNGVRRIVKA